MLKQWYNVFLLGKPFSDPIIEPIANFCKVGSGDKYATARELQLANLRQSEYDNALKNNAARLNELLKGNIFSRGVCSNGYCYFCDSNGNCYYCQMDNNNEPVSCVYYTKNEMDNINNIGWGSYILDRVNPTNIFKVGTIGNYVINGLVAEGFNSTIKNNTGETVRFANTNNLYNRIFMNGVNMTIGILCLIILIIYLYPQ